MLMLVPMGSMKRLTLLSKLSRSSQHWKVWGSVAELREKRYVWFHPRGSKCRLQLRWGKLHQHSVTHLSYALLPRWNDNCWQQSRSDALEDKERVLSCAQKVKQREGYKPMDRKPETHNKRKSKYDPSCSLGSHAPLTTALSSQDFQYLQEFFFCLCSLSSSLKMKKLLNKLQYCCILNNWKKTQL